SLGPWRATASGGKAPPRASRKVRRPAALWLSMFLFRGEGDSLMEITAASCSPRTRQVSGHDPASRDRAVRAPTSLWAIAPACRRWLAFFLFVIFSGAALAADRGGNIRGVITDPLGAVVSGATVDLLQGNRRVATTSTDSSGNYQFPGVAPG